MTILFSFLFSLCLCTDDIISSKYISFFEYFQVSYQLEGYDNVAYKGIDLQNNFTSFIQLKDRKGNFLGEEEVNIRGAFYNVSVMENVLLFYGGKVKLKYYLLSRPLPFGAGFAYNFNDKNFSLIHQLKAEKKILRRAFGFSKVNQYEGKLFLGGLPSQEKINKNYGYCNIVNKVWGCELHYFYFYGNRKKFVYENKKNYTLLFQSGNDEIEVPTEFMEFLKDNLLNHLIEINECYKIPSISFFLLECNETVFNFLPSELHFVIGDFDYTINTKEMFKPSMTDKAKVKFAIHEVLSSRDKNFFILGGIYLSLFNSEFDYDNSVINFYSSNKIEKILKKTNNTLKNFYVINILIILAQTAILIFGKLRIIKN